VARKPAGCDSVALRSSARACFGHGSHYG
jgi:hypothetical protein